MYVTLFVYAAGLIFFLFGNSERNGSTISRYKIGLIFSLSLLFLLLESSLSHCCLLKPYILVMFQTRFACSAKKTPSGYDQDILVDYEPIPSEKRRLSKETLAKQLQKCRKTIATLKQFHRNPPKETELYQYQLEYTEKGKIKKPTLYDPSSRATYQAPINMQAIRSIVLNQHCNIIESKELDWFGDGLKWLSQQQYQNSNNYRYYIQEERHYTGWSEKKQSQIEDYERACEAYFGIPLSACEDSWAAEYLVTQASKGKLFRRVALKSSVNNVSFSIKKLWCCGA
ncbi:hypothetical protein BD560DRAFT_387240 [Blakeslea trispora]|nr:hypothetical protein BD560DRAFT_387240 [Blakeslea trispora]